MSSFKSVETANFTQPNSQGEEGDHIPLWDKMKRIALQIFGALCGDN